jgi:hypothetical protein
MTSGKRSKKVQEKRSHRANYQIQQRRQQQQRQEQHMQLDENLINIFEDFHINPLNHQQLCLYKNMLEDQNFVIIVEWILLVLIFLAVLWYIHLLESFLA